MNRKVLPVKVLLISANTEQFNMPAMPLGLGCVAAAARRAGHDVALLDLMFEINTRTVLKNIISEFQPECIGISVRNIDDQNMGTPQFLLGRIKDVMLACRDFSSAPIVLGGAGYSIFPQSALAFLEADMGIEGDGEVAFTTLLSRLEARQDFSGTPGLHIRGRVPVRPQKRIEKLDGLLLPDAGILSDSAAKNREPWIPVQTRRGCALKCSYCSTPSIEGTTLRKRSPDLVAAWLERWVDDGFKNFFFVDNTFNLPPAYARQICRQIIKRGLSITWQCIIYPKHVDAQLVELMAAAGCRQVSLGFESGSERILKNFNKRFSLEDIQAAADLFARHGIHRMGFLLLGGPGETDDTIEESLAFADSLKLEALRLTLGIRIYPNTPLADIAQAQGFFASPGDLLHPHFYLTPGLDVRLSDRLKDWAASRPHVIL
jgi:radical SAM superfamily enzyme YgiQ (UPF0313 family)